MFTKDKAIVLTGALVGLLIWVACEASMVFYHSMEADAKTTQSFSFEQPLIDAPTQDGGWTSSDAFGTWTTGPRYCDGGRCWRSATWCPKRPSKMACSSYIIEY